MCRLQSKFDGKSKSNNQLITIVCDYSSHIRL